MTLRLVLQGDQPFVFQEDAEEAEAEEVEGEEEEHAEEGDPPNPVLPTGNELVAAAICFFALWALMKFVLIPPILRMREERVVKMRGDNDAADKARDAMAETTSEYQLALAGARSEANGIIEAARAEADARRSELQASADDEISRWRAEAQAEIDAARQGALAGLKGDVSSLAVEAASLVVQKPVNASAAQSVIDRALEERS